LVPILLDCPRISDSPGAVLASSYGRTAAIPASLRRINGPPVHTRKAFAIVAHFARKNGRNNRSCNPGFSRSGCSAIPGASSASGPRHGLDFGRCGARVVVNTVRTASRLNGNWSRCSVIRSASPCRHALSPIQQRPSRSWLPQTVPKFGAGLDYCRESNGRLSGPRACFPAGHGRLSTATVRWDNFWWGAFSSFAGRLSAK